MALHLRAQAAQHRVQVGQFEAQDARRVTGVEARVERGFCLVPETRELFGELTVYDNLVLGAYPRRSDRAFVNRALEAAYGRFPRLAERRIDLLRAGFHGCRPLVVAPPAVVTVATFFLAVIVGVAVVMFVTVFVARMVGVVGLRDLWRSGVLAAADKPVARGDQAKLVEV